MIPSISHLHNQTKLADEGRTLLPAYLLTVGQFHTLQGHCWFSYGNKCANKKRE
jgi:hypothetical protein